MVVLVVTVVREWRARRAVLATHALPLSLSLHLHPQLTLPSRFRILTSHAHHHPWIRQFPHPLHQSPSKEDSLVLLLVPREPFVYWLNDADVGGMKGDILGKAEDSDEFVSEEFNVDCG